MSDPYIPPGYDGPTQGVTRDNEAAFSLYGYIPSLAFSLVACILYALVSLAHAWHLWRYPSTRIAQGIFLFAALWEMAGYICRAIGHEQPFRADLFTALYCTSVSGATVILVAIQLSFFSILPSVSPLSIKHDRALSLGLVIANILSGTFQTMSVAFVSVSQIRQARGFRSPYTYSSAQSVLIASFAVGVAFNTMWMGYLTWVAIAQARHSRGEPEKGSSGPGRRYIYIGLLVTYFTSGTLWTRSIYRLIESTQGFLGPIFRNEALFGVFEFAVSWAAIALWAVIPAGWIRNAVMRLAEHSGKDAFKA